MANNELRYTDEEVLDAPIKRIIDGWQLDTGELYLFVEMEPGFTKTIAIQLKGWPIK